MKTQLSLFEQDREALRALFELADDSTAQINSYMHQGWLWVARHDEAIVGYLQLIPADEQSRELKSMAVLPSLQGKGVGRALIEVAVSHCREQRVKCLLVSTAAAGIGQLRFYQRAGFRMLRIERDAFTAASGYPEDIVLDGILLRDRVWLSMEL